MALHLIFVNSEKTTNTNFYPLIISPDMEQFIVSARKYRPTSFEDVVGQRAITKTLENAIENNHLAQALLFTGPRGVGKTTCARILAKRINQDGTQKEDEDFAFNVFELDAASNNSVDDIRSLIEQVRIPPQVGKYKVYIIDEVHMLSTQAFNAFLKTLEEPPKHAIFILATTEKHKIIPTILSRCQIFDFRRIGLNDIKEHLARVAAAEGITAEDDALHIIAQKADGALRDALSTFDRVVSFSGKNLTREAVAENLHVLDYSWYFKITDLILNNNIPEVLLSYNKILSLGFDGQHFISGLASHFRDLLVGKNPETISLLEIGDQTKKLYLEQSQKVSTAFLIEAIDLANSCSLKYRNSENQRLLVELCLMQLSSLNFQDQKKNPNSHVKPAKNHQIISPEHFKSRDKKAEPETNQPPVQKQDPDTPITESKENQSEKTTEENGLSNATAPSDIETKKPQKKPEIPIPPQGESISVFSLKSVARKRELKEQQNKHETPVNLPEKSFTEEEMQHAWKEYAQLVESQGKHNLLSHLTMNSPKLEGTIIQLEFPNHTIKTELEAEKTPLLQFLRQELENHKIDLEITVNETIKKKYAYSPKERYDKLKSQNPLIDRLKDELGLTL